MKSQISISRAQGCLFGQLAGDSLGSLVEFQSPQAIKRRYPSGVRYLADGGYWDTIAGQPTDDSEMALKMARTLIKHGDYDPIEARKTYIHATNPEEGVVDTINRGGDTDTNAAICGSLLGSVYGRDAIPIQWIECLNQCRPESGRPNVRRARPRCFWPIDASEIANRLIASRDEP